MASNPSVGGFRKLSGFSTQQNNFHVSVENLDTFVGLYLHPEKEENVDELEEASKMKREEYDRLYIIR
ncbi:hypothetical protein CEXT_700921 [Caerostris extrusa]|uniref:Uncharacterized protein n=1 Tax=Caerostris extrusa TaxID=172846 RepID=A0AAV4X844_CAEEX|nr:hypothetical protein CEXT_700921 [Caerostris extrusa]